MTLDKVRRGQKIEILSIPDNTVRMQAIRLGLNEGTHVRCSEIIPKGPVIIQKRMQEIAIGRKLAEKIKIRVLD